MPTLTDGGTDDSPSFATDGGLLAPGDGGYAPCEAGACAAGARCKYELCVPDLGPCATNDDCPGDSYCDTDLCAAVWRPAFEDERHDVQKGGSTGRASSQRAMRVAHGRRRRDLRPRVPQHLYGTDRGRSQSRFLIRTSSSPRSSSPRSPSLGRSALASFASSTGAPARNKCTSGSRCPTAGRATFFRTAAGRTPIPIARVRTPDCRRRSRRRSRNSAGASRDHRAAPNAGTLGCHAGIPPAHRLRDRHDRRDPDPLGQVGGPYLQPPTGATPSFGSPVDTMRSASSTSMTTVNPRCFSIGQANA